MVQHAGKANIAEIAQKLEGQKRSVVAPFEFLTPPSRSSFRCGTFVRNFRLEISLVRNLEEVFGLFVLVYPLSMAWNQTNPSIIRLNPV